MPLIRSVKGLPAGRFGQAAAKPSYVLRPRRRASEANSCSVAYRSADSSKYSSDHF
jgi:hypothetical protein